MFGFIKFTGSSVREITQGVKKKGGELREEWSKGARKQEGWIEGSTDCSSGKDTSLTAIYITKAPS